MNIFSIIGIIVCIVWINKWLDKRETIAGGDTAEIIKDNPNWY